MNYYNEFDHKAASWLQVLIDEKQIPYGHIDTRSITDVSASDLDGFTQCHFFAGVGGWSLALKLSGWPEDREVWTGSCPCQPFSCAGRGMGVDDERHLWPDFRNLIGQRRPAIVFGEQVASKDGLGWLAGVSADMETGGYRFAAADLCAAGVGAPQKRQRLYWLADDQGERLNGLKGAAKSLGRSFLETDSGMVLANGAVRHARRKASATDGYGRAIEPAGGIVSLGDTDSSQSPRFGFDSGEMVSRIEKSNRHTNSNAWSEYKIIQTADGKNRRIPIEPVLQRMADGISYKLDDLRAAVMAEETIQKIASAMNGFPLAESVPNRVAILKGYGNAIIPDVAKEFILAYLDSL